MHTLRERLLAILSLFFSLTSMLLAAVGLYGVLDYSVLQRRREIGIRLALGAPALRVTRGVAGRTLAMTACGAAAGTATGWAGYRYLGSLLYGVRLGDWMYLSLPAAVLLLLAVAAAIGPVLRAVRLDPLQTLRAE